MPTKTGKGSRKMKFIKRSVKNVVPREGKEGGREVGRRGATIDGME